MNGTAKALTDSSYGGQLVEVQCHLSNGLPGIVIVGFAAKATDEARERIRSAFASSGLTLPRKRITINLAPADIRKEGTGYDLAIAAAILQAANQLPPDCLQGVLCLGELGLDGSVRPLRGMIGKLLFAKEAGFNEVYLPQGNSAQGALVDGPKLHPVSSLRELFDFLAGLASPLHIKTRRALPAQSTSPERRPDFSDVIGQPMAKRALEVAAAGGHNVLLYGPPGTGKSMLAKAFIGILPPLALAECLEVTHLHSLAGQQIGAVVTARPLRSPHHTASDIALIGGGAQPRPGEISLSHKGVLFLDEFPEFSRAAIEALRQPLEEKSITVSRQREAVRFPADFILVATQNPCPCGYFGSSRSCACTAREIASYERRLSGPVLDRIDLHVSVDEVPTDQLLSSQPAKNETSADLSIRVIAARNIQAKRFRDAHKSNSHMTNHDIKHLTKLEPAGKLLLDSAGARLGLSARAYLRTVKVARTIADLAGSARVTEAHVSEALQYRRPAPAV